VKEWKDWKNGGGAFVGEDNNSDVVCNWIKLVAMLSNALDLIDEPLS
jgi:hypothetical protein